MPLWHIFAHPDLFTPTQRAVLVKDITNLMVSRGLPAFYVNVFFIQLESDSCYVGGVPKHNFVRIVVEQIARQMPRPDTEAGKKYRPFWMDLLGQMLAPHFADRPELEWELHLAETNFDLWRVQGLQPPKAGSAGEQQWKRENRARPCEISQKIEFLQPGMTGTSCDPILA